MKESYLTNKNPIRDLKVGGGIVLGGGGEREGGGVVLGGTTVTPVTMLVVNVMLMKYGFFSLH